MSYTDFSDDTVSGMTNLPNLSIFRLLAYQKICNDHYQFRQWQGYDASSCNVDYVSPSGSMDLSSQLDLIDFTSGKNADRLNFLDLRFSNLPLDYLNGVLPTAQFGSESVVSLGNPSDSVDIEIKDLMVNRPSDMTSDKDNQKVFASSSLIGTLSYETAPKGKVFIGESTNGNTFTNSTERFSSLYGSLSSPGSNALGKIGRASCRERV